MVDLAYTYLNLQPQVTSSLKSISDRRNRQVAVSDPISPDKQNNTYSRHQPRKLVRRLGQEVLDQIVREKLQGASYPTLVQKCGVSKSSLQRLMRKQGR